MPSAKRPYVSLLLLLLVPADRRVPLVLLMLLVLALLAVLLVPS